MPEQRRLTGDARVGLQVIMPAEEVEREVLEELGGSLDELGQLFAAENDGARLALEGLFGGS